MWPLVFAGAAALVALMSQSKKQSSGKKSYEDGLKDGEAAVKKRQDDEKEHERKINRLVEKRMSEKENESSFASHRSRFRRARVEQPDETETTKEPKTGEAK